MLKCPVRLIALICAVAALLLVGAFAGPANAQSADRIAANLNESGYYVETGSGATEAEVANAIAQLESEGVRVLVAALSTDPPNPQALAESLRDKTGGTVVLVTPGTIAAASVPYSDSEVSSALDISFDRFDVVGEGVLAFGRALPGGVAQTNDSTPTSTAAPATTSESGQQTSGESGGGGIGGVLIFFGIVIAAIVGLVMFTRSRNRKKVAAQIAERRAAVKAELDAIGLDIVEVADSVTMADNDEATTHFRQGNEQFLALQEQLEVAKTLWEVTEVDYAADTAAWHLDAAEALVEGKPVPEEPDRPDLTTSRPPDPTAVEAEQKRADERDRVHEREKVDSRLDDRYRRPKRVEPRRQRRDRWQAPPTRGGSLGDVATGILVGGILRGGGKRKPPKRWNGAGTLSPRTGGGSASRSRSRSRGGGSASRSRSGGGSASRRR